MISWDVFAHGMKVMCPLDSMVTGDMVRGNGDVDKSNSK